MNFESIEAGHPIQVTGTLHTFDADEGGATVPIRGRIEDGKLIFVTDTARNTYQLMRMPSGDFALEGTYTFIVGSRKGQVGEVQVFQSQSD